ncbi:hypothetical protein FHR38_000021 [Micromonospora polyrhachis]|uniref:Uncharacterized protein n=1 Tax=Micromonospora polyrhachis TaxID=1282883 RepID=A0A7W7SK65_9ACTN|nr:hypothetical protein [Micromonospora polyrhachis]
MKACNSSPRTMYSIPADVDVANSVSLTSLLLSRGLQVPHGASYEC